MEFSPKDAKIIIEMIAISKKNKTIPDFYIPWDYKETGNEKYLSDDLVSLHGHELYDTLTDYQKRELGRHESVQVSYSYAWSEGLACSIFNRRLLNLDFNTLEYKFLLRELIEEFRHQAMFSDVIEHINGRVIKNHFLHRFFGKLASICMPSSFQFFSIVGIELVTDAYGKIIRKDKSVHVVLRKTAELHHIEEARHIFYGKAWLKQYTDNAGIIRRSLYATVLILSLYFMRTTYVHLEIFKRIQVKNPEKYYKAAYKNLKLKFGKLCLDDSIRCIKEFNGINCFTKFLLNFFLDAKIK